MDFKKMSDADLVKFRDDALKFHCGIAGDTIVLDRSNMKLSIRDEPRLNDLIFNLFIEAHNELCDRFNKKIILSNENQE